MGTASRPGPMALLADQHIKKELDHSLIENGKVQFLSESDLAQYRKDNRKRLQSLRLAAPDQLKGYATFESFAQAMGNYAQELEKKDGEPVIAILFRDSDGRQSERSKDPKRWNNQQAAMKKGFLSAHEYQLGVPMIPKPKSEAWLLCALTKVQHCNKLEELPGNDTSATAPKKLLEALLGKPYDNDEMIDWIKEGKIEIARIRDMPSCTAFKKDLTNAIKQANLIQNPT